MPEITPAAIAEQATKPKSVSVDGMAVSMPSAQEQIEAGAHKAANDNASSPRRGLLFTKLIPGSAVGQ